MLTASKLTRTSLHAAGLLTLTALALHSARAVEIKLPPETAALVESPLPGFASAQAICATCHSVDYILSQPGSLSRTFWKTNVVKMQKTFGAPIPDAAVDPIVDYLVKTYGAERAQATSPAAK
jgi:sulfite dehydrogenase